MINLISLILVATVGLVIGLVLGFIMGGIAGYLLEDVTCADKRDKKREEDCRKKIQFEDWQTMPYKP